MKSWSLKQTDTRGLLMFGGVFRPQDEEPGLFTQILRSAEGVPRIFLDCTDLEQINIEGVELLLKFVVVFQDVHDQTLRLKNIPEHLVQKFTVLVRDQFSVIDNQPGEQAGLAHE